MYPGQSPLATRPEQATGTAITNPTPSPAAAGNWWALSTRLRWNGIAHWEVRVPSRCEVQAASDDLAMSLRTWPSSFQG